MQSAENNGRSQDGSAGVIYHQLLDIASYSRSKLQHLLVSTEQFNWITLTGAVEPTQDGEGKFGRNWHTKRTEILFIR